MNKKSVLRILDANANRCREGLRVAEDLARFITEDVRSAGLAKKLRHRVTTALGRLNFKAGDLTGARDAEADLGRPSFGKSERSRPHLRSVLLSNLHRAQEAARVLEEISKILDPRSALAFKQLRYGIYTLEKEMSGRL